MPAIVIEGIVPWDGSYPFDNWLFTNKEFHRIREICGIRAGELLDALDSNDRGAYVAVAYVVMQRHGHRVDVDELWEGKGAGTIRIDLDAGGDVGPPVSEPADGSGQNENSESSGPSSESTGD